MSTSTHAANVSLIHQGHENGCTKEWRCEIHDPCTHVSGIGYGDSEREAYNDAKVDFQDNAASVTRQALREANEGFERIEAQTESVDTGLVIGTTVDVPEIGKMGDVIAINGEMVTIRFEDGTSDTVHYTFAYLVFEGQHPYSA